MELLLFVLIWPLLIFAVGVVGVVYFSLKLPVILIIALVLALSLSRKFINKTVEAVPGQPATDQLEAVRGAALVFSIALLWPVFSRFLVEALNGSLAAVIAVLVVGFGLVTWGMFLKSHKSIMYSNIFGGALTIAYAYQQLWELGEGARVAAAAFGLVVAVAVAIVKFRDKLK